VPSGKANLLSEQMLVLWDLKQLMGSLAQLRVGAAQFNFQTGVLIMN
jgi:hypothetical protein